MTLLNSIIHLIISFIFFLLFGCHTINKILYTSSIIKGNHFTNNDIKKIYKGMKKKQIINILGDFTIESVFEFNTYYYISLIEEKFKNIIIKKILKLNFDKNNFLVEINYNYLLLKNNLY